MKKLERHGQEDLRSFLTVEGAAEYLGIKVSTIYQYTSKKILPHYKIRRKILFKVTELNEFIESHRVHTSAEIEQEALGLLISGKV